MKKIPTKKQITYWESLKGKIPWNKDKKTGIVTKTAFKKGHPKSKNAHSFKKGHKLSEETKIKIGLGNKGKKHSKEQNTKHSEDMIGLLIGEKNSIWKGDEAGSDAMHDWIKRKFGTPNYCEHCKKINKKVYDWANIDHTYKRKIKDYIRLCRSCHRQYDIKNNDYSRNRNIKGKFI